MAEDDRPADDEGAREATELRDQSMGGNKAGGESRQEQLAVPTDAAGRTQRLEFHRPWSAVKTFWKRQVRVTVSHDDCRDHFGEPSPCYV